MPLSANPFENPAALNFVVVAGVPTVGVARLLGSDGRPYKWQTKETAGAEGATQTYRGWKLASFKFRFEMWEAFQVAHFEDVIVPLLRYDATKQNPQPVAIYYPLLAARDVNAAVVTGIGPMVDLGGQLWSVEVEFEEFRPAKPKNVTTTPKSSKDSNKGAQVPSAEDILDVRLRQLRDQWKRGIPKRTTGGG